MPIAMLASPSSVPFIALADLELSVALSVDRLLKASGAQSSMSVAVAGPMAGACMSVLWRRGFERVEAARRVTSSCADQQSDLLLVVGCIDADQASAVVSAVLPILRQGGVLATDAGRFANSGERLRFCRMLAHRGLRYREGAHVETDILARKPELEALFSVAC
jgi:hypothetical protein